MGRWLRVFALGLSPGAGLLGGCSADDREAPDPASLVMAKAPANSGDEQVGVAGTTLALPLRVLVTRDGEPAGGVTVFWSTPEGSVEPASSRTGADGTASSSWTLRWLFAQQVAFAGLASNGPAAVAFTAIATPDPAAWNTILVRSDGGNRFDPTELTIAAGDTANWVWAAGSVGHNIVPDDGDLPLHSGAPDDWPRYHSNRMHYPGVYHYHCMVHGGPGGVGMSGTIIVLPLPSPD